MKEIFEINKEEVEKKADEYIKNLKYDATEEEKKQMRELYIANGLHQLEKMKNKYDLEYQRVQRNREKAKKARKQNLRRIKRG